MGSRQTRYIGCYNKIIELLISEGEHMKTKLQGKSLLSIFVLAGLVSIVFTMGVNPAEAGYPTRQQYFEGVAVVEAQRGDNAGAQYLRRIGSEQPQAPPGLSQQELHMHHAYVSRYDQLRNRLQRAIIAPDHLIRDQWRVDRAEADLHLVYWELRQGYKANPTIIQTYLADAVWALDHTIKWEEPEQQALPPMPTASITADPATIVRGNSSLLRWNSTNANQAWLNGENVSLSGTRSVSPSSSESYEITARNEAGSASDQVIVTVVLPPSAPTAQISVNPSDIVRGNCAILNWSTTSATQVQINGEVVTASGTREVCPTVTTTYTLVATGPGGKVERATTLRVREPAAPTVDVSLGQSSIEAGKCVMVSWTSSNAETVALNGENVSRTGSRQVCPTVSTNYSARATGAGGTVTDAEFLTVIPIPTPTANITVTPSSIMAGQTATLNWTTSNATSARIDGANVPLSGSRTVSPMESKVYRLLAQGRVGEAASQAALTVTLPAAPTANITASPATIHQGECATVTWSSARATTRTLNGDSVSTSGSREVCPTSSTSYTIIARNLGGTATADASVTVVPWPAPTASLSVTDNNIERGECVTLAWATSNVQIAMINGKTVDNNGSMRVCPATTTNYVLTASGRGGEVTDRENVVVVIPAAPTANMSVSPDEIIRGDCARLSWSTTNAASAAINGNGVALDGNMQVCPTETTNYVLRATGKGGEVTASDHLVVVAPKPGMYMIHFDFDEAFVRETAVDTLAMVANRMRSNPAAQVTIEGHTDAHGSDAYNMELGMQRAQSARDYLVNQYGINPTRFNLESLGERDPIAPNRNANGSDNPEGREKNRRTEFHFAN